MFVGEDLNQRQIKVLQAVADTAGGALFASLEGVKSSLEDTDDLDQILNELQDKCLVERKKRNGKSYVGLTSDGKRCNLIFVYD